MPSVTVTSLIARIRGDADMKASSFVSDAEILEFIQDAYEQVYEWIVQLDENFFRTSASLSVVNSSAALPTDCHKICGVDTLVGTQDRSLKKFAWSERNSFDSTVTSAFMYRYCLSGLNIVFRPKNGTFTATLYYIPHPPTLTSASSISTPEYKGLEYVIATSAALCVEREERNSVGLRNRASAAKKDILDAIANRDMENADSIRDIYGVNWDEDMV